MLMLFLLQGVSSFLNRQLLQSQGGFSGMGGQVRAICQIARFSSYFHLSQDIVFLGKVMGLSVLKGVRAFCQQVEYVFNGIVAEPAVC